MKLPAVRRCCIDQSGLGRQFAERATKTFGAYKVEGISFTTSTKEELAYPVRVAFEDRTLKVPFTNAIRADLRGVRREVTGSGHIRFAGERNRYGHCDRFWALALALHAAKKPASGAITSETVKSIHYGTNHPAGSKTRIHTKDASAKAKNWLLRNLAIAAIAASSEGVRCAAVNPLIRRRFLHATSTPPHHGSAMAPGPRSAAPNFRCQASERRPAMGIRTLPKKASAMVQKY